MNNDYQKNGYILIKGLFSEIEIDDIHNIGSKFHELWKKDNEKFYSKKAVKSLTTLAGTQFFSHLVHLT